MALSFDDLLAEETKEAQEKGTPFIAKGGVKVILRPVLVLPDRDQNVVLTLSEALQKDDLSIEAKKKAVDQILIAAADKKDAMKKSLADLTLKSKTTILQEWMKGTDLPEASPSAS